MKSLFHIFMNFLFGCLIVWAAASYFGVAIVAIVLAWLAIVLSSMSLNFGNGNSEELKHLRERISTIEKILDRSHDRLGEQIESLDKRMHAAIVRLDALTPSTWVDSD